MKVLLYKYCFHFVTAGKPLMVGFFNFVTKLPTPAQVAKLSLGLITIGRC